MLEGKGYDLEQLRTLQDWFVRYQLTKAHGVAEVASVGGFVKQYQVAVDPNRLRAYKIPITELMMAIQRNNLDVGGGAIETAETEYVIRSHGYIKSLEDIRNIVVMSTPEGTPILVRDLAEGSSGRIVVRSGPDAGLYDAMNAYGNGTNTLTAMLDPGPGATSRTPANCRLNRAVWPWPLPANALPRPGMRKWASNWISMT